MSLTQFGNSIGNIMQNRHLHRPTAVVRHCGYQVRKALNLFPFEQLISRSRIVAAHRRCGVSALIYSQGLYDYNNMRLLQFVLRDGGVFFDVGANVGSYTLVASEQQMAVVYAFEPHPLSFRLLQENVRLNDRDNVRPCNLALGASMGTALLTDDPGSAMNRLSLGEGKRTIPVQLQRGDLFCSEHGVRPTVMKVDVEGHEHDVLDGFGPLLASVDLLQIEMMGWATGAERDEGAVHRLLQRWKLVGPLWCDFDAKTFSSVRPRRYQDSVYLSKRFRSDLERHGFRVMVSR